MNREKAIVNRARYNDLLLAIMCMCVLLYYRYSILLLPVFIYLFIHQDMRVKKEISNIWSWLSLTQCYSLFYPGMEYKKIYYISKHKDILTRLWKIQDLMVFRKLRDKEKRSPFVHASIQGHFSTKKRRENKVSLDIPKSGTNAVLFEHRLVSFPISYNDKHAYMYITWQFNQFFKLTQYKLRHRHTQQRKH